MHHLLGGAAAVDGGNDVFKARHGIRSPGQQLPRLILDLALWIPVTEAGILQYFVGF